MHPQQMLQQLHQEVVGLKGALQGFRGMVGGHEGRLRDIDRQLGQLSSAMGRTSLSSVGGMGESMPNGGSSWATPADETQHSIRYIEAIPGRRVPFDFLVSIPIPSATTTTLPGTKTVPMDGPFVAVARMATFQSGYGFSVTDPETSAVATFQGRSYGRFRPISSVNDFNDAGGLIQPVVGLAFPGTGAPIVASPSNHAGFRTMQLDAMIEFLNQGSAYPRQNEEISSAFYGDLCTPFQLGALDFFERGETLQWKVRPTHPNNPNFGNLSGYAAGGLYPFLDSQFDVHEGVSDPLNPDASSDPVRRLPEGILQIGFHGFKIIQPPGVVQLT